jgi:hypothetical protein
MVSNLQKKKIPQPVRIGRLAAIICILAAGQMGRPQRSLAQQPAGSRNGQTIADSQNDFSNKQGTGGWSYLFFISNKDGTDTYVPDDARRMWWAPARAKKPAAWAGPEQWYNHTATSSEPVVINGCFQGWAVRRWTSDRTATLHITGHASRDSKDGDGVGIKLFIDGKESYAKLLAPASATDFDLSAAVHKGSLLDFVVTPGPGLDATFDSTGIHITISSAGTQ